MEEKQGVGKATYNPNGYKIVCGQEYKIFRSEFAGNVFYKIQVVKTGMNNEKLKAYKLVKFASKTLNCDIKNETIIKPKRLFEDFYFRKNEVEPRWVVVFLDWDIVETDIQIKENAIEDYRKALQECSIEINDDDLPF